MNIPCFTVLCLYSRACLVFLTPAEEHNPRAALPAGRVHGGGGLPGGPLHPRAQRRGRGGHVPHAQAQLQLLWQRRAARCPHQHAAARQRGRPRLPALAAGQHDVTPSPCDLMIQTGCVRRAMPFFVVGLFPLLDERKRGQDQFCHTLEVPVVISHNIPLAHIHIHTQRGYSLCGFDVLLLFC